MLACVNEGGVDRLLFFSFFFSSKSEKRRFTPVSRGMENGEWRGRHGSIGQQSYQSKKKKATT